MTPPKVSTTVRQAEPARKMTALTQSTRRNFSTSVLDGLGSILGNRRKYTGAKSAPMGRLT